MYSGPTESSMFAFRMWRRVPDSARWRPTSRLLVHVNDGVSGMPAHLSWGTEDGGQSSVGFAANMESCYGHGRRPGRHVVELRGELDHQVRYARGAEGPGGTSSTQRSRTPETGAPRGGCGSGSTTAARRPCNG